MPPLLFNVEAVPEDCCNEHLEEMQKAVLVDPATDGPALWAPHENVYLRNLLEDVTKRFQQALELLQDAFARLLTGEPIGELQKALDQPWMRWDEAAFEAARVRLNSKSPAQYTLDDWMLSVDYLIQRYLPDGVIKSDAEYLAVRAAILGKVQANIAAPRVLSEEEVLRVSRALPFDVAGAAVLLNPVERRALDFAAARGAINIKGLTERTRGSMKNMIVQFMESMTLGDPKGDPALLRSKLFDSFGQFNRDFRRIAVTETGECCNQGFIAAQPIGAKVKRLEAYRGACPFCKSISGKVFTVVAANKLPKDGQTEVWLGKTNVGRSASSMKRSGSGMIERPDDEKWWPAAGVQHPGCRGRWLPEADTPLGVDPAFAAKLKEILAQGRPIPPAD